MYNGLVELHHREVGGHATGKGGMVKTVERVFERVLWESRLLVVLAVITSLLVSLGVLFVTTVDVWYLLREAAQFANTNLPDEVRSPLRTNVIGSVVIVLDGYLLAVALLIFALGLYELFINKIEVAEGSMFAERLLLMRSFDDLKDRLAKIVILMLVVKFFEYALQMKYASPLDLLYLAVGILLIGAALWLTHQRSRGH